MPVTSGTFQVDTFAWENSVKVLKKDSPHLKDEVRLERTGLYRRLLELKVGRQCQELLYFRTCVTFYEHDCDGLPLAPNNTQSNFQRLAGLRLSSSLMAQSLGYRASKALNSLIPKKTFSLKECT